MTGSIEVLREALGLSLADHEEARIEAQAARARSILGDEEYARQLAFGRNRSADETVSDVLSPGATSSPEGINRSPEDS